MVTANRLHRTLKLELEQGRAETIEQAEALVANYVLQVAVGPDVASSPTRQSMLLTAINTGVRAFPGGVHVVGYLDWAVTAGWGAGERAIDVITWYGGTVVTQVAEHYPTLVIGTVTGYLVGSVVIHLTWEGWAGGVVTSDRLRLWEAAEHPVAGVLAGALGVSEAFQHIRGSVTAGRRSIGLSLWNLAAPWGSEGARGPALRYLPTRLWLLGLGHLGQAYLWVIGLMPYRDPTGVSLWLQDFDHIVHANRSTGLLVSKDAPDGLLKTRLAAEIVEKRGLRTRLVERPFDERVVPGSGEPRWALAGFDRSEPRRHLGAFDFAVDLGLGASQDDYLGIHLHTFPAAGEPPDTFKAAIATEDIEQHEPPRWAAEAADDVCGVVQLEGVAVGAAFVGAVAAALGLGEILRALAGGTPTAVAALSLAAPQFVEVVRGNVAPAHNAGYQVSE